MHKLELLSILVIALLGISISYFPADLRAQSQSTTTGQFGSTTTTPSKTAPSATNSIVSVSSSITIPLSNETVKTNEATLKSAVAGFLNSGPNVLKLSNITQVMKTKVTNNINNVTQNIEGIEASNAVIGVEIGKALKSVLPPTTQQGKTVPITVTTSSTCKPSSVTVLSCDNSIEIK